MLEILQFVFKDFWTWVGCFLMLGSICAAIGSFRLVSIKNEVNNMTEDTYNTLEESSEEPEKECSSSCKCHAEKDESTH